MRKFLGILICLIFSLLIVFGLPYVFKENENYFIDGKTEKSLIEQNIIEHSNTENTYYKIYESGKLIGV